MLRRRQSRDATKSLGPSGPTFMTSEQVAEFLTDLRTNRPPRPGGSRPLPTRNATTTPLLEVEALPRAASALSGPIDSKNVVESIDGEKREQSTSAMAHRRTQSTLAMNTISSLAGRPLIQEPHKGVDARDFSGATRMSSLTPSGTYRERGDRWIEREEARSLREALQEMDLKEEQRLHAAAQKEASELVWRHRAPHAPYQNPDLTKDYKSHLRKGSHARSLTTGRYSDLHMRKQPKVQNDRSVSDSSDSRKSDNDVAQPNSKAVTLPSQETKPNPKKDQTNNAMGHAIWDSPERKAYMNLSFPLPPKSSTRRRSSGQKGRKVSSGSGKGLFKNPEDQIYEEPDEIAIVKPNPENTNSKPLSPTDRNPNFIGRGRRSPFDRSNTAPVEEKRKLSSVEVYKNPPSQSRNPSYMQNALPPTPPDSTSTSESNTSKGRPVSRDGMEVRSDEIRAATSMRLKDRSSKLPTPSVVSDRPGRPIVSFDRGWKAKEADREAGNSSCPSSRNEPSKTLPMPPSKPHLGSMVSAPEIPTINLPDSPSIQLNDSQPLPTINIPNIPSVSVSSFDVPTISPPTSDASSRPLPNPAARSRPTPANRPLPHHSSTTPAPSSHTNRSSLFQRATAQCAACALPIAGRIVSAASQRFHPACFSCFQCGELLECVAFYPEPESFRSSRLARIQARLNGVPISDDEARKYTEEDDGDDGLRFYCHLDFHEKFSPRCRNCKTPIEGEVVVACGGEWHVGHFFCAECGDPFDASTPFVEKNGYAWCVGCHSKRFSGKCAGCRRPIVDMVVKALEREWHEECFCCRECGGKFEDGKFFTRDESQDPVCVGCEERRLKA